jgi:hypothetical protein
MGLSLYKANFVGFCNFLSHYMHIILVIHSHLSVIWHSVNSSIYFGEIFEPLYISLNKVMDQPISGTCGKKFMS